MDLCNGKSIHCTKPRVTLAKEAMIDLPLNYPRFTRGVNLGYKVGADELLPTAMSSALFTTT